MSQNTLRTTSALGNVRVSAGWDRRTHVLFCNVLAFDLGDDEDEEKELPECLAVPLRSC